MNIIVYTGDNCPYCPQVKKYLQMKGKQYKEINVDHSENVTRTQLQQMTGQMRVPVTMVNGEFVTGFNLSKLADLLEGK